MAGNVAVRRLYIYILYIYRSIGTKYVWLKHSILSAVGHCRATLFSWACALDLAACFFCIEHTPFVLAERLRLEAAHQWHIFYAYMAGWCCAQTGASSMSLLAFGVPRDGAETGRAD